MPGLASAVLALAFGGPLAIALVGNRLSLLRQSMAVLASQLLFHWLFSLTSAGAPGLAADVHDHAAQPSVTMATMSESTPMGLSHLAAAATTIVALRFGVAALSRLYCAAVLNTRRVLCVPTLRPVLAPRVRSAVVALECTPLHDLRNLIGFLRHRGPPASRCSVPA